MVGDIPVVGHGAVVPNVETGAGGLGVRITGGGLRPPAPSSVEPSGIPTRPTDDPEPIPLGDEADAAGPAKGLLPLVAQVPDAVPAMPPPSKTEVAPAVPAVDVPTLEPMPKEVCGIEAPMPPHVVTLPFVDPVGPIGDTPEGIGLTPGDASSVAPRGIPAGATGEPGPMPSGEVMPSGEGPGERLIPPTCAMAELQLKRIAAVVVIIKRVIVGSTSFCIGRRPASPGAYRDQGSNRPSRELGSRHGKITQCFGDRRLASIQSFSGMPQ